MAMRTPGEWVDTEDSVVMPLPTEDSRRPGMEGAGRKIIIVDDDRDTRMLLQFVLEQHGFTVAQAPSGLRLISLLHVDKPDLILLDVMMSWINGFELCRAIKSNPNFRDIPICFISARSDPASRSEGMACRAADYFVKPLDLDQLIARIDTLLEPHAAV
jgi:DNA-binding response OmpR family regulator